MTDTQDRLLVAFSDDLYRPAKGARIRYDTGDYFYIKSDAPDDVKIDYKLQSDGVTHKPLEQKQ